VAEPLGLEAEEEPFAAMLWLALVEVWLVESLPAVAAVAAVAFPPPVPFPVHVHEAGQYHLV
jgi:hypothetical protein